MTFEKLEIRQLSQQIAHDLWEIFYNKEFKAYWFQDQIMRAVISISNNIAEWYERKSIAERKQFLYYAKWSCAEVKNMIYLWHSFKFITIEQKEAFLRTCTTISVKTQNFITSLKQ